MVPAEYQPINPWKPGDPMTAHPAVVAERAICDTLEKPSAEFSRIRSCQVRRRFSSWLAIGFNP